MSQCNHLECQGLAYGCLRVKSDYTFSDNTRTDSWLQALQADLEKQGLCIVSKKRLEALERIAKASVKSYQLAEMSGHAGFLSNYKLKKALDVLKEDGGIK